MNNEEAKFLLQGYRSNGRDARDPQFDEALEQVKRDPTLERWFREQQACDAAISEKLRLVAVPANLKEEILAGRKTLQPVSWWTRRSRVAALAACFVLMLGFIAVLMTSPAPHDFAGYRADMVHYVAAVEREEEPLRLKSEDMALIRDWLSNNVENLNIAVPAALTVGSGVGCSVVDWNGESVALACFRLAGGEVAHLLVINRKGLSEGPAPGARYVASLQGMNTAAWSTRGETYLLVSSAPAETLQGLL